MEGDEDREREREREDDDGDSGDGSKVVTRCDTAYMSAVTGALRGKNRKM